MTDEVENVQQEEAVVAQEPEVSFIDLIKDEELKNHKVLHNIKDVDTLVKNYVNAQSLVGKRVKDMSPEDIKEFDAKFGVPETIEGYDFEADESVKALALKAKLNVRQAAELAATIKADSEAQTSKRQAEILEKVAATERELEKLYGVQLKSKVELAKRASTQLGGEELTKRLFDAEGPLDVDLIRAFVKAGEVFGEHQTVPTESKGLFHLSRMEITEKINELLPKYAKKASGPAGPAGAAKEFAILEQLYLARDKAKN